MPDETATPDLARIDVIAPNFKRRLSGVTATVIRLVPLQAREIAICTSAPEMPEHVPNAPWAQLLTMPRKGPSGARVWHARRNVEMIAGLALKWLLGKHLRLVFTSASQRPHTGLTRWLIRRMDTVIATSARTATYLERPAMVIRHGIDCDAFAPPVDRAALRQKLGLPNDGPVIGCFGRIRAQKGTDVYICAMLALLGRHPDACALVMGRATKDQGGFLKELKNRVAGAGLSRHIRILPEVPVWEMPRWYQSLDLYVAPQRWEGFGLTPLEAMACGVPVIATRVGAFEELIEDGQTGTLVPPGDARAIATAADMMLSDPAWLTAASEAARTHVLMQFRIQQEAAAINAIYRRLLST